MHLVLSALVAGLAGVLVFALWYPWPYREISGGRELFALVVGVDIVIGPLITLAVFDRRKPRAELRRDLVVVGLLQLAALGYGLWTVQEARPVHLVFEYDRFRVVHLADIPPELHARAPEGIEVAPLGGPTTIALRPFRDNREHNDMTMQALTGVALAARTELWAPYGTQQAEILRASRPAASLLARYPQRRPDLEAAFQATGRPVDQLRVLPVVARKETAWTALLDGRTAGIIGFVPVDSF